MSPSIGSCRNCRMRLQRRCGASSPGIGVLCWASRRRATSPHGRGFIRWKCSGYSALFSSTFSEVEIGGSPVLTLVRGGQVEVVENGPQVVLLENQHDARANDAFRSRRQTGTVLRFSQITPIY